MNKRQIGFDFEKKASEYLIKAGLRFVCNNYQCQMGEIDLVMQDSQNDYVFVEVRYRENDEYGDGALSVTSQKQARIIRASSYYLVERNLFDKVNCRFDVISIAKTARGITFEWIQNAFQTRPLA